MPLRSRYFIAVALLSASTGVAGCGAQQAVDESASSLPQRARFGNLDRSAFAVVSVDLNGDGTPDQHRCYRPDQTLAFIERDFDFDGNSELFEHYDARGNVIEREYQLDFDAAIDSVRFYADGILVRHEVSTRFEQRLDLVEFFGADGEVARIERDADYDGRIDTWQYFEGGSIARIGRDLDGDGQPETFEDAE